MRGTKAGAPGGAPFGEPRIAPTAWVHPAATIIGNDGKGVWTRTYGLAKIPQIMGVIENVMAGRVEETSSAGVKP